MNLESHEVQFEYEPPLTIPGFCEAELVICMADARARITVRDSLTRYVVESRPECQLIEDGGRHVIVAMPGTIQIRKLPWGVRLLRWLARG
jgi:hypothetical protein